MSTCPKTKGKPSPKKTDKKVLKFSAVWCRPCKLIQPAFERFKKDYKNIKFISLDVDDPKTDRIPSSEEVSGIPAFQFFKGKKMVASFTGANVTRLKNELEKLSDMK